MRCFVWYRVISTWSQKLYLREITPGWQEAIALTSHKHTCYPTRSSRTDQYFPCWPLKSLNTSRTLQTYIVKTASKRPSVGVFTSVMECIKDTKDIGVDLRWCTEFRWDTMLSGQIEMFRIIIARSLLLLALVTRFSSTGLIVVNTLSINSSC